MPIVAPGNKVLVTGANGYIALYIIRRLLEQGYFVRGTVRSDAKGSFLRDEFKSYGDRFELVIVGDVVKEGAFDEAVKGADAILHIAAPVLHGHKDPKEAIDPAVKGTIGILRSARTVSSVKRVILMGSVVSVLQPDLIRPLNENDWNESCVEEYETKKNEMSGWTLYQVQKVLSERAAWSFYNENKKVLGWDLVVMLPPFVNGPYLGAATKPSEMNTSAKIFYDFVVDFNNSGQSNEALVSQPSAWVDVRDISFATVKSLSVPEAAGERIIVSAGGYTDTMQDWVDAANSLSPSPIPSHAPGAAKALPIGNPGAGKLVSFKLLDVSKVQKILGLKYITMEQCVRDTLADYERRGW